MNYPLFVESDHTTKYKAFRRHYPRELYTKILEFYFNTTNLNLDDSDKKIPCALDVGCGSGQATVDLSHYCHRVIGIDGSENQLKNAPLKENIEYQCQIAENLTFLPSNSIDLVTVAIALHWFDIQTFFEQVDHILKPNGGVLSIWCHETSLDNLKADEILKNLSIYDLRSCWNDKTQIVIENYESIIDKFPYQQTKIKHLIEHEEEMSIDQFVNMIETWSLCQTYCKRYGEEKLKQLLETFTNNLAKCYAESSNDINSNNNNNAISDKKMIVKWTVHLHLMKKQ
ncbi:unnamed protein product [Rotaria sordida]|uniref:Methyltransferase type 11 domain-containing protein n=1 Tax=Rotaria sordida TaxID=392033 RepID=A0A819PLS5_9BILA|nr:unnamed protein product [Rotaria sordida]CAF3734876.1 unnamed protein product [Rotaria sordida]CAF4016342.1 unnamed protein product [Rotaria sordida]